MGLRWFKSAQGLQASNVSINEAGCYATAVGSLERAHGVASFEEVNTWIFIVFFIRITTRV